MKKCLLLGLICLLTLCGCGEIPKLQNGEEAVITFAKDETEGTEAAIARAASDLAA